MAVRPRRILDLWWFRFLVRAVLAVLALALVVSGTKAWGAFSDRIVEGDSIQPGGSRGSRG